MQPDDQPDLFHFLRTVAVASGRGKLTRVQAAVAVLTALDSDGTTGTGVVVNAGRTAEELDISERQMWRHFRALVAAGWFEQTVKPTKGSAGEGGRRARYRVRVPLLDLGLPGLPTATDRLTPAVEDVSDDRTGVRVTPSRDLVTDDAPQERLTTPTVDVAHDDTAEPVSSDSFGVDRLTVSAEPSDIAEREVGTVPTSDGSTSDGSTSSGPVATEPQDAREAEDEPSPTPPVAGHRPCKHTLSGKPYLTKDGACLHDCGAIDLCYSCVLLSRRGKPVWCYRHTPTKATA